MDRITMVSYPQATEHSLNEIKENINIVPTSPYVRDFNDARKKALLQLLPDGGKVLKFHQSLCPGCMEEKRSNFLLDSMTYVRDNKVWIVKKCQDHGAYKEIYWSDFEMYKKAEKFQDTGIKLTNTQIEKADIDCPKDCGLCSEHESHTALGNLVVTSRCDLSCWYCFFYSKEGEPVYEPTIDQIKFMLKRMKEIKPVSANALQLTGGEPTLRDDLLDIIKVAKDLEYKHVQLNTNGINLAKSPELALKLRAAGINNLYMSFDGVTPQTNPKNYWEAPSAIESCRKAGIGVVLVPTVIGGINDHELGDIIRFAKGNIDTVRSVNFQPVSLVGRMPDKLRAQQRITIPGAIKRIEEQTDGQIGKDDFYPIPCAQKITDFIEAIKETPKYRLSTHFACGMATYAFKDGEGDDAKLVPITRFFDVDGFFEYLENLTQELKEARLKKMKKSIVLGKLLWNIRKFVNEEKKPKDLKFVRMLAGAVGSGNYHELGEFHKKSIFIGMMHFQDPYNWDIDRVHKCDIHYAVPDGRILPFCTFNVIPELYRDKVQREFAIPAKEWEEKTGKRLLDDRHKRNISPEQLELIKQNYDKYRRSKEKPVLESDWGDEDALSA
jgi:7,8-dihydro-6-hydroxymethylpterin dimethyltransferase